MTIFHVIKYIDSPMSIGWEGSGAPFNPDFPKEILSKMSKWYREIGVKLVRNDCIFNLEKRKVLQQLLLEYDPL